MAGTRGAKRKRGAVAAGFTMDEVAQELAVGRSLTLEQARARIVTKRLRDSNRHAERVQSARLHRG